MIPIKRVTLTQFMLPTATRNMRRGRLADAINAYDLTKKWGQTGFAKKIAKQERRAELTDFERFQVMVLKRQVGKSMRKWLKTQRKSILQG